MLFALTLLVLAYAADSKAALLLTLAATFVPALVYARMIVSIDRFEPEPRRALLQAFLWGGGGAVIFSIIAEIMFAEGLKTSLSADGSLAVSVVIGAPFIEETFKGLALLVLLWLARDEFDGMVDGLIYGAMIGLGFSVIENVGYLLSGWNEEGIDAFGQLFVARVLVNGLGHSVYTGVIGAAVGYSRSQYRKGWKRFAIPFLGFLLGVFLHMAWNLGVGVIAYMLGEGASLLEVIAVAGLVLALPALLIFTTIARRAYRREIEIMRRQLATEVAYGVLAPGEYDLVTKASRWRDRFVAGSRLDTPEKRFAQMAGELAFRKEHLSRGDPPTAGELDRLNYYRAQISYLRQTMQSSAGAAS